MSILDLDKAYGTTTATKTPVKTKSVLGLDEAYQTSTPAPSQPQVKVVTPPQTQTISGVIHNPQPNLTVRPPGFVGPIAPAQPAPIYQPLPPLAMSNSNSTPATLGSKAIEQQNANPVTGFFKELPGALGTTAQTIARAPFRAGVSVDASIANNPESIVPTTPIQKFFTGDEPIVPIARQVANTELALKDKGLGKASLPLSMAGVIASTGIDLTPFGLGGADEKLGKQAVTELTELLGKGIAKDEALNTIYTKFGTKIAKVVEEKALPKIEEQLAKQGTESTTGKILSNLKDTQLGQSAQEIRGGISPQTVSESSQLTADTVRGAKAEIANSEAVARAQYADVTKTFTKAGDKANIGNISEFERTGKFAQEPKPGYSEFYKQSMDNAHATLQQVYGDDRVGYIENYVRRQYAFGSKADETKGTQFLSNYVQSLGANKTVMQSRTLTVPLEDALSQMKAAGINVKPVTTNPELLRQWTVANANRAATYAQAWQQMKESNLIQFVKASSHAPEGLVVLDDRAAKVFFPSEAGKIGLTAGQYYADPAVARVLNNSISKGLESSPTFKGLRAVTNTLNQFQLGLSGFHFTGSAINAGISDMALGLRQLATGKFIQGGKNLGTGLIPFASFAKDIYKGANLINELKAGSPEAARFLEEKLNPAGGRLGLDTEYYNKAYQKMVDGFSSKTVGGAISGALHIPGAIVETVAKPLMQYAIPRVKIGAFMDLADDVLTRLPVNTTDQARTRALAQAWDSIDNRFGQLVYDNLFWNKTAKDLAMVSTRSLGWNLGTIRELGGGLSDVATKTLTGKGVTDRTMYALTLPLYAGMIGATYQYLHTGKGPSSLKDYFYPKNGLTTTQGNPDRISLPTYMKDVYSYSQDPFGTVSHKASPLLSSISDLAQNQDFYGNLIRNPDDPKAKQLEQMGLYAMKQFLPFSVQQAAQYKKEAANPAKMVEAFTGFTKAAGDITKSKEQLDLEAQVRASNRALGPMTPEQQKAYQDKKQQASDFLIFAKEHPDEATKRYETIQKANPSLGREIKKQFDDRTTGTNYTDKLVGQLGVESGVRAQWILNKIKSLPKEQRNDYYKSLQDKKIATAAVDQQLANYLDHGDFQSR